jgi:hypothetical protein
MSNLVTLPRTARQQPSTIIKGYIKFVHSVHHSTTSPFCLLSSESTMSSELHLPPSFYAHRPSVQ